MAKPNFTLPNKPAIKSGSILSYNYTDDFTFVPTPLTFNRDSAATRVNEKGLIEDVGYFGPELVQNGDFSEISSELFNANNIFNRDDAINTINSDGTITTELNASKTGWAIGASAILNQDKIYKVEWKVISTNSNSGTFWYWNGIEEGGFGDLTQVGSGVYYVKGNASGANADFRFNAAQSNSTITWSLSVKEVGQNWETEGSSSLELADFQGRSNVANINILNTITSSRIRQSFDYVNGKRYKVSVDVYLVSGNFRIDCSDTFVSGDFVSTSTTGSWITLETEIQAISTGSNYIWLRSSNTVSQFYVSNVSVIEILGDKPRIDYSDSLTEPSLLLEPQSTNLVTYSEDFTKWVKEATVTLTSNYGVSPDGTQNSTRVQMDINDSVYISATSGNNFSIYVKGVQGETIRISNGGSLTHTLTGEWDRISLYDTGNSSSLISINTYSVTTARDIEIWGAQLEALSYPTSYIPTSGSTATRLGETANNAGDVNVFNSEEGVLYAEIAALADDGTNRSISLSDGSVNNRISLLFGTSSNRIRAIVKNNNSTSFDEEYEVTSTLNYHKVAIKYKLNNFALWIDSVERFTDTSGSTPIGLNKLMFDVGSGILPFYGKTKDLKVFNKALTDRELEILTT